MVSYICFEFVFSLVTILFIFCFEGKVGILSISYDLSTNFRSYQIVFKWIVIPSNYMAVVVNGLTPVNWSYWLVLFQQLLCKKLVGMFSFYKLTIAIHDKYHVRRENWNRDWKTFITWLSYCLSFLTFQGHEEKVCVQLPPFLCNSENGFSSEQFCIDFLFPK